jgi:hypothetical protein
LRKQVGHTISKITEYARKKFENFGMRNEARRSFECGLWIAEWPAYANFLPWLINNKDMSLLQKLESRTY